MGTGDIAQLLRRPIVVAPMAGGPSTPELVVAATEAGALGMLAGGYLSPDSLGAGLEAVRSGTGEPFGVNLFVPGQPAPDAGEVERYLDSLAPDAAAAGVGPGEAVWDDDHYDTKVELLLGQAPALVSFTFGCPSREVASAFQDAGSLVAVTVTSPQEAQAAVEAGAEVLCLQGVAAGAHRGTFLPGSQLPGREYGLLALIAAARAVTDLPLVAAGGIMTASQVQAVLAAGAVAAQCGTAFLRCPESGAHAVHKAALSDERFTETALTRAFSGRPARGLVNRFMLEHPDAPAAYPEINNATRPLRAAAGQAGDADRMSLWAGQGWRLGTDRSAGEVVDLLAG